MSNIYLLADDTNNMDKKKILKNQIKKSSKYTWIVGPYDPYQPSHVPGAYLIATSPSVPGGNSKV